MKYYCEDSQQVLQELNSQKSGLTEKEAAERLLQNGANELKAAKGKSLLRRFAEQVADPMIVILLAAAAISGVLAVLENDSFADVIIILAVVLINAVLGVYQESKAEKAIEALQDDAACTCTETASMQTAASIQIKIPVFLCDIFFIFCYLLTFL